ncbi:MAG: sugar ABC transporter ATP-binding protein [Alicyclobacillus sp.]|nr:sugar ABC transporter ATP-binding protein [Alicyclobacillus sp.]
MSVTVAGGSGLGASVPPAGGAFLEVRGISKSYGGVKALVDCNFSCHKGEVHALLGENGAGKSTLVKILCGVVRPDAGSVWLNGRQTAILSPADAAHKGIVAVFQELSLVPELSVAENVFLGHEPRNRWGWMDLAAMREQTKALFDRLGFSIPPEALVRDLSLSDQQLVEIGKALSRNPELIIFDEATSALGHEEVELLFQLIRRLAGEGKAIIFISHRMAELDRIADRATVFRDGRYITTFPWGTVDNAQIVEWIAGRGVRADRADPSRTVTEQVVLEVRELSGGRAFQGINLSVRRGEILGIAGLQGHGQNQFLRALFGSHPITGGEVRVAGRPVALTSPRAAIDAGVVLVPEDRKRDGLLLTRSIQENIALMTLDRRARAGFIRRRDELAAVCRAVEALGIKAASIEAEAWNLSGGNQQKVVIAKAILTRFDVLLLADPTRGIDIGTKSEIYRLMRELAGEGRAVVFYSTEIPELVEVSHRVAVFKQGRIAAVLEGQRLTEHEIISAALGIA